MELTTNYYHEEPKHQYYVEMSCNPIVTNNV